MNPRHAATIALQAPTEAPIREPDDLVARDVCPHCKRATVSFGFLAADGHAVFTHHCREHGDVFPMRSHVANAALALAPGAAK